MVSADEYESAQKLVDEAVTKLKEKNPKHELLHYWLLPESDIDPKTGEPDPKKEEQNRIDFYNRFWKRDIPWQNVAGMERATVSMMNYWSEVTKAIKTN